MIKFGAEYVYMLHGINLNNQVTCKLIIIDNFAVKHIIEIRFNFSIIHHSQISEECRDKALQTIFLKMRLEMTMAALHSNIFF